MARIPVTVLAIGNELLSGAVVDTNTAFLARTLAPFGFSLSHAALVPDDIEIIANEIRGLSPETRLLITTGGLGPTSDDLTRQAIAAVAGTPLVENGAARAKLEEMFRRRNRPLNENNLRQVIFPEGAEVLTNRSGTADAFCTTVRRDGAAPLAIVSLPGIPRETEVIVVEEVVPLLSRLFPENEGSPVRAALRVFGLSESYIGERIESCGIAEEIEIGYRPIFPEILVTLLHRGAGDPEAKAGAVEAASEKIAAAVGPAHVFAKEAARTIPQVLIDLLRQRGLTLAAAESCTGGQLSSLLVAQPGASDVFLGGAVAYANEAKSVLAGVRPLVLEQYGAVSREVAIELARGVLFRLGANIGVSVTGIAGPDGGTPEKPVGSFWIGLATTEQEEAFSYLFPNERNMFRTYAATLALDLVRRHVLGLALTWARV